MLRCKPHPCPICCLRTHNCSGLSLTEVQRERKSFGEEVSIFLVAAIPSGDHRNISSTPEPWKITKHFKFTSSLSEDFFFPQLFYESCLRVTEIFVLLGSYGWTWSGEWEQIRNGDPGGKGCAPRAPVAAEGVRGARVRAHAGPRGY